MVVRGTVIVTRGRLEVPLFIITNDIRLGMPLLISHLGIPLLYLGFGWRIRMSLFVMDDSGMTFINRWRMVKSLLISWSRGW